MAPDWIGGGGLGAPFQPIEPAAAAALLREGWGISGVLTRLRTERDDTFRVEPERGATVILKLANPSEEPAGLAMEAALLIHLARRDPDLPVPRVIPDRTGAPIRTAIDHSGQVRHLRLLSYLDGRPLSEAETTLAGRERIGALLARFRLAAADFDHPGADRVLAWDLQHFDRLASLKTRVVEPEHRLLIEAGFARWHEIAGDVAGWRRQVLHNDLNLNNILVSTADPARITGLIDVGDAVKTAVAIDLAVALRAHVPAEIPVSGGDPLAGPRDLLRGYCRVAPLAPSELALLPTLIIARLVQSALLAPWLAHRRPDHFTNLPARLAPIYSTLSGLMARDADGLAAELARGGA